MEAENAGRGRGRGRGGVPILPQGMWDSLQTTAEKPVVEDNWQDKNESDTSNDQYDDAGDAGFQMPMGFGRGRGRGDFGRGFRGAGRGRGLERDMKGKDWECPSCTNVNWSWRTNCNKCNTAKPNVLTEAENRDGAGKGFNERQARMSASTVEVDEEGFDDFGRRVKKDARADRKAKEEAALARMQEKYKHLLPTGVVDGDSPRGNGTTTAANGDAVNNSSHSISTTSKPAQSVSFSDKSSRDDSARDRNSRDTDRPTSGYPSSRDPPRDLSNRDGRAQDRPPQRGDSRDRRSGNDGYSGSRGGDSGRDGRERDTRDTAYRRDDRERSGGSGGGGGGGGGGYERGREDGGRKRGRSPEREDGRYGRDSRDRRGY